MKHLFCILGSFVFLNAVVATAASPEEEKAFIEKYRKAIETQDEKALGALMYTEGADAETVEFFMMMSLAPIEPGSKIESIELVTPTEQEKAKFNTPMEMPDGKKYVMPFAPIKQIVVKVSMQSKDGSSTSTSKAPVGEKNGKLVIPVPVPAK